MRIKFLILPICLIICVLTLTNIVRITQIPIQIPRDVKITQIPKLPIDPIVSIDGVSSIHYKVYEYEDLIADKNNVDFPDVEKESDKINATHVRKSNNFSFSVNPMDVGYDLSGRKRGDGKPHMYSCSTISDKWTSIMPSIVKQQKYEDQKIPPNFFEFGYIENSPVLDHKVLLLNPKMTCRDYQPDIIVMCSSAIKSFKTRKAVRETWGKTVTGKSGKVALKVIFIIGDFQSEENYDQETIDEIYTEFGMYKDILQIQVDDSYRAMTVKRILGLRWGLVYCETAKHVIYATDDIVINIDKINKIIEREGNERVYFGCSYPEEQTAITSGRYEIHSEPPTNWKKFNLLPRYNIGFSMLLSRDSVILINALACKTPITFPDDIYLGILLKMVGIAARGEYKTCGIRHKPDRKLGVKFAVKKFSQLLWNDSSAALFVHLYERSNTAELIEKIWKERPNV